MKAKIMSQLIVNHIYIIFTILFAVSSQFLMRWQGSVMSGIPSSWSDRFDYFLSVVSNGWILLALSCSLASGISWFLAMTKFELNYAYPFVSLNYVLVLFLAPLILNETITASKVLGTLIIIVGILVILRG